MAPEITANALLGLGAAPATIDLPGEAAIFAGIVAALPVDVCNGSWNSAGKTAGAPCCGGCRGSAVTRSRADVSSEAAPSQGFPPWARPG